MSLTEKFISREDIYDGAVLHVVKDRVRLSNGEESFREICLHSGAAAVIPITEDGRVAMVRQYRYAHSRAFLEIPAGKLEMGEDPLDCAKRELREETGAIAKSIKSLGIVDTSPALMSERIYLYLAEELSFGEMNPDDGELLECELIPLNELIKMVEKGEICDSKTQIAILKVARMRGL